MRYLLILALSIVLVLGVSSAVAFAATPTQGYVAYTVNFGKMGAPSTNFVLNESSTSTGQNGLVSLTFALISSGTGPNLTYSKVVNSSSVPEVFPFLPGGLSNQSISYQNHSLAISAHILNTTGSSVTFNGKSYETTNYQLMATATNTSSGTSVSVSGSIVTMPSGLVYSAQLQINSTYSTQIKLLATSLPLTDSPSDPSPVGLGMVTVGVVGSVGLAVPSIFLKRRADSKTKTEREKPSYWVD